MEKYEDFFSESEVETAFGVGFRKEIEGLIHCDIAAECTEIKNHLQDQYHLSQTEVNSLNKIVKVYEQFQIDAKLLYDFGKHLRENITKQCNGLENWPVIAVERNVNFSQIINHCKEELEESLSIKFIDYPLTENFYLMLLVIGAAQFNKHIEHLMQGDDTY